MRKMSKGLAVVMTMATIFTLVPANTDVQAASKKSKVTYELKDGTLTISGKGAMPKTMTFQNNKKIKKVVIKKGVTSISKYAFSGCKNLKKVKIPKTVKEIGWHSFEKTGLTEITIPSSVKTIGNEMLSKCESLKKITMPGKFKVKMRRTDEDWQGIMSGENIESVTFNTDLSLKTVGYCFADNLYVSEKDPNYKSIDGVIYSKDGKDIVRVPSERTELTIEDGCTTFCLQSITYGYELYDYGTAALCDNLKKITIPQSVEKIDESKYYAKRSATEELILDTIEINTDKLSTDSIVTLLNTFYNVKIDDVMKQLPEKITKSGNMYISDDDVLIKYTGKEKEVTLPENIKEIASEAFKDWEYMYNGEESQLEKVNLPEGITKIGDEAFLNRTNLKEVNLPESLIYIGSYIFALCDIDKIVVPGNVTTWKANAFSGSDAKEIVIPNNMKAIPEGMFAGARIKSVVIPDSVEVIGKGAFECCYSLENITFGKNVKEIHDSAFSMTGLKKVRIPASVKKIGEYAFSYVEDAKITIKGSKTKIASTAFYCCQNTKIAYKAGVKKYQTTVDVTLRGDTVKDKTKAKVWFEWVKVSGASGYDIRLSNDKNFKKKVIKMTAKKKQNKKEVTVKLNPNKKIYVKIRPYKIIDGKKVYGKWTMDCL